MGILDDAIREHLDLKRRHGVPEEELQRQEEEALGPARRDVAQQPEETELAPGQTATAEAGDGGDGGAPAAAQETALFDMEHSADAPAGEPPADAPPAAAETAVEPVAGAETEIAPAPAEPLADTPVPDEPPASMEPAADAPPAEPPARTGSLPDGPPAAMEPGPPADTAPPLPPADESTAVRPSPAPADDASAAEPAPVEPPPVEPPPVEPPAAPEPGPDAALGDTQPHGFDALGENEDEGDDHEDDLLAADAEDEELDVLEDTPDFLQETPEHDRLWFEQKPPRDFDFD